MDEVNFSIGKEVWHVLVHHPELPEELRRALEDETRTSKLNAGYEAEWSEAEATKLRDFAKSYTALFQRLVKDIQQELNGLKRKRRERSRRKGGKP